MKTWIIESLNCIPSLNGKTNVVCNVHWKVIGSDGTNKVSTYGAQEIAYNAQTEFHSYENLTEEEIIEWVKNALGTKVVTIENLVDKLLSDKANPSIITPVLPLNIRSKGNRL